MSNRKPKLESLLAESGGSARNREPTVIRQPAVAANTTAPEAKGSVGTSPITVHFPKQVRDQLKILAVQNGTTLHGLIAEAYNDLFAKYGKGEGWALYPGAATSLQGKLTFRVYWTRVEGYSVVNEKQRAMLNWLTFLASPGGLLTNASLSIYTGFAGVAPGLCTVEGGEITELQPVRAPERLEYTFAPDTKVSALKIVAGGDGHSYWFPYVMLGVGECEIPKNVPVGTVALTAGMNGCSLRIYEHTAFDLLKFCHDNNGNYVDHDALVRRGYHHLLSVNASARTRGLPAENINNYWHGDFDAHVNSGVYFISVKSAVNEWKVYKSAHMAHRRFELVPAKWTNRGYTIVRDRYEGGQRHNGLVATLAIPVAAPVLRTRTVSLSEPTVPAIPPTRGRAGSL